MRFGPQKVESSWPLAEEIGSKLGRTFLDKWKNQGRRLLVRRTERKRTSPNLERQ